MQPTIEDKDEVICCGIAEGFTFASRAGIPELWGKFSHALDDIEAPFGEGGFGVSFKPSDPAHDFDYMTSVGILGRDGVPETMHLRILPAGKYAIFDYDGLVHQVSAFCDKIFNTYLPESGLKKADGDVLLVEEYLPSFDPGKPGGLRLWVPIAPAR